MSPFGVVALALLLCVGSCTPVMNRLREAGAGDSTGGSVEIERALWTRIHGAGSEQAPPIYRVPIEGKRANIGSDAITLRFDMQTASVPNLVLQVIHCDRNWNPTDNIFIQDPMRLQSTDFTIERSPLATSRFDYTVSITFPSALSNLKIEYSGNYLARVIDYFNEEQVIAEARFFAVEPSAEVAVESFSDFYESTQSDVVQHGVKAVVEAVPDQKLFTTQVRAIHLYQNGFWRYPMIADQYSRMAEQLPGEIWPTWSSFFAGRTIAEFRNIPAGNEHRVLDLTDLVTYPTTGAIITTPLSDLPRNGFHYYDNNGVALDRIIPVVDNDYVYFQFRLGLDGQRVREDICVVGTFNDWTPTREWRMYYDEQTGSYSARGWIKRAVHEYEYVAGTWDEDKGTLLHADATLLEGNVRDARLPLYAFVYYSEPSSGGYDRLIGAGTDMIGAGF